MCSVFENVENHAYSQKPFGMKNQFKKVLELFPGLVGGANGFYF